MYNHHQKGTSDAIVSLQHDFGDVITTTTMHMHLSDDNCLEMIIVKGDMEDINKTGQQNYHHKRCEQRQIEYCGQRAEFIDAYWENKF